MHNAAQAYARTAHSALAGRELEAAVLQRCANDLQRALQSLPDDPQPLLEALNKNLRLWGEFGDYLRYPDTEERVTPEFKNSLLSIARGVFARQHRIAAACAAQQPVDPGLVEPLITVNRSLAQGLGSP
jgi:flagellar biosynthesis activator protein FlaF